MNYQILKTEIANDPASLGYSGQEDQQVADLLNEIGLSGETINNDILESYQIVNAVDVDDWTALSDIERERLKFILCPGEVDISNANIKAQIGIMFGVGTDTRTALLALTIRPASRGEILFGNGISVSSLDVHIARRL